MPEPIFSDILGETLVLLTLELNNANHTPT